MGGSMGDSCLNKRPPSFEAYFPVYIHSHAKSKKDGQRSGLHTHTHTIVSHFLATPLRSSFVFPYSFLWPNLLLHSMRFPSTFVKFQQYTRYLFRWVLLPCGWKERQAFIFLCATGIFWQFHTALYRVQVWLRVVYPFFVYSQLVLKRFRSIINYYSYDEILIFCLFLGVPDDQWGPMTEGKYILKNEQVERERKNRGQKQRDQFGCNLIHARQRFLKRHI